MWKYKYVYHSPSQYWILIVIGIKPTPNTGKASGRTSQRENKNDIHTHTHTHTHAHLYILLGLRKKKLSNFAIHSCHQFTINSLSFNQIIFCPHPYQQIPQYGHLLKPLSLKSWYSVSQDEGTDFQTTQNKKFIRSVTLHSGNYST